MNADGEDQQDMASETAPVTPSLPKEPLAAVEYDIFRACNEARRDRASVTLIAVSKTFDADAILPVIAAGLVLVAPPVFGAVFIRNS